jgi:hypothetical protein
LFSTNAQQVKDISDKASGRYQFLQWFIGFTDGEGYFLISFNNKGHCAFKFEIGLHRNPPPLLRKGGGGDDKGALDFIHKELEMGKVWVRDNKAFFTVIRKNEINSLIGIFTKYPLKSSKGLNFLDFKKAFELYTSHKLTKEILNQIESIKKNMNSLRTNYDMKDYYKQNDLIISAY